MDEERLYVQDAMTGKHKRFMRLRYHAKGTGSYMKKDTSRITIRLEERPIEDMYKRNDSRKNSTDVGLYA